jgi:DNA-binding XRE family transcriptional regulator
MENKSPVPNNSLALSLTDASGPEIDAPSCFARALKQARFRKGWTQAKLAAQLAMTKRTIVSWETATRIPSIGMVMALLNTLSEGGLSLHHELLYSYIGR